MVEALSPGKNASEMQTLISEIARALVDEPESVRVTAINEQEMVVLRLEVAPSDVGKVIGKQGRTARSIRTLLGAVGTKLNRRFSLEILE